MDGARQSRLLKQWGLSMPTRKMGLIKFRIGRQLGRAGVASGPKGLPAGAAAIYNLCGSQAEEDHTGSARCRELREHALRLIYSISLVGKLGHQVLASVVDCSAF